ncbi:MAG: hypothetical protein ABGX04_10265 [Myxococcales bacterium]
MFFESNSVFNFGNDTFVPTIPTGCGPTGCDFGLAIGTAGTSQDDIQTTTFVLSHLTEALTVDVLAYQGLRSTSQFHQQRWIAGRLHRLLEACGSRDRDSGTFERDHDDAGPGGIDRRRSKSIQQD